MNEWIHLSPVILTDDLYFGNIPDSPIMTGSAAQRRSAYLAAEQAMIAYITAPLLPTTITGTFMWPEFNGGNPLILPHSWIRSIDRIAIRYDRDTLTCELKSIAGCATIRNSVGYIDVYAASNALCQTCGAAVLYDPYLVEVTYTAGLPTGIAAGDTSLHTALAMVAEQKLMNMIDPGALPGGPGAPGAKNYSSLGYSETTNDPGLKRTPLGSNPVANEAANLTRHLKKRRGRRL